MKKKPLPDHRTQARDSGYYRPSEEEVTELAHRYNFKADFPLRDRLEYAYSSEETARNINSDTPTLNEQKKLLEALRDRCLAVEEAVKVLGSDERCFLYDAWPDIPKLSQFQRDSHNMYLAAHAALSGLKNQKGKRERQENIWNFVWQLADIWQEGKRTQPTCGHNDIQEIYVGDFYRFVVQCASLGNIQLSKGDPGGIIAKILEEWRQRDLKQ